MEYEAGPDGVVAKKDRARIDATQDRASMRSFREKPDRQGGDISRPTGFETDVPGQRTPYHMTSEASIAHGAWKPLIYPRNEAPVVHAHAAMPTYVLPARLARILTILFLSLSEWLAPPVSIGED